MENENSNPETGEISDDAAVALLASRREAAAQQPEEAREEPEGEPGAEEPETPEGEPGSDEGDEEEPQRFTVKVDGAEHEVTLDELLNGYQRDADYRRKTQTLADERRGIQAERERQQQITARLIQEHQRLAGNDTETEPDWAKLAREDPIEYVQQKAAWDAKQTAKEQRRQQADALANRQRLQVAQEEAVKLRQAVPEWADGEKFKADYTALVSDAGKFYGFPPEEVGAVLDHRVLLVLRDAAAYRALQASKPVVEKRVSTAPKSVVKPGSPATRADARSKDMDALRHRLRATGSDDDAVALLRAKRTR